jgi:glycosyltransferase involved in cell wall biosynthesis
VFEAAHRLVAEPGAEITFAIPYYAGRALLQKALESALRQTEARWRLLVCDDCGEPNDLTEWIASFRDDRLSYVRNDRNLGMAENWNRCLDRAATDLVTLLHADDELRPHYAETMIRAARQHPAATAFFCRAEVIDAAGAKRFSFPDWCKRWLTPARQSAFVLEGEAALHALTRGNFIMCPTLCFRKNRLAGRRFSPRWRMVLDLALIAELLLEGEQLIGLPHVAYAYRRHERNATEKYTESLLRFREESDLLDELALEAGQRGWGRAAQSARAKRIVKLHVAYRALRDLGRLRFRRAGEKLRFLAALVLNRKNPPADVLPCAAVTSHERP